MARRGFSDFVRNFGLGYGLVNQIDQDLQLGKIADAKPVQSQGFTAEDGKQLEAIANAKDAEGKPLYQVTANEDGSYGVATTADPSMAGVIRQQGVTEFLGQRTAGEMTPAQVDSARQRAMAGVIMRTDPVGGGRMLRELTQDDREAQRFSWDKQRNERDLRRSAQAEDDETFLRNLDAEAAQWHAERLKNPDGTSRAATTDDFLAATQWRAFKMAEAGRLNEASQAFRDYAAQSHIKLQLETEARNKALGETASRLAAGDLNSVRDFYNQFVPDGAKVIDVRRGADGQITIERESLDGRKMPATVMKDTGQLVSALATFRDPMAIYNWSQNEFRNNLALKADARASAAEGRAAAEFQAGAPQRQLAGAMAGLQMAVVNAKTPEDRAQAQEKFRAAQAGLGLNKKEAPSGFRWKENGDLEAIPGGPGDKKTDGKPMPGSAAKGLLENQQNLRRAQSALALSMGYTVNGAAGDKAATGLKGYLPNQLLNRLDPEGVDTRAAIADLGSLVIHDRSGAAVTAAEFPRLAPFIPTEKDDAETVQKKLKQFVSVYETIIQEEAEFYRAQGYNVPTEVLKPANVSAPIRRKPPGEAPGAPPAAKPAPTQAPGQGADFSKFWG